MFAKSLSLFQTYFTISSPTLHMMHIDNLFFYFQTKSTIKLIDAREREGVKWAWA